MPKTMIIGLLVLSVLIYLINSKHTPIIVKNNIKSFLIQTIFSFVAFMIAWSIHGVIYQYNSSIIIYNTPGFPNYAGLYKTYNPYYSECIIRTIFIILYIVFGMSLTKDKSKIKNFISVFICYLVLIIINQVVSPQYFENLYVWIPHIFISYSTHVTLQRMTPLIYHTVFYVILFIPTLFIWLGLEVKNLCK
ncbi:hypothetical protein [Clostridium psychrophilum]|uniref:hypothetical protein n=1 Tax=Clostridium psychrophilum TaxID=132926 RepID=UPI001C0D62E5|nr:hypothetical protein [Clostridium psychrophilum]MBU3182951.1 hypothetical protein [Clostridium psychrophilum]